MDGAGEECSQHKRKKPLRTTCANVKVDDPLLGLSVAEDGWGCANVTVGDPSLGVTYR